MVPAGGFGAVDGQSVASIAGDALKPTVLELGHAVAEAMHLDPLWADDPADYA